MMRFNKLFLFSVIAFTLASIGCSGGGGGGNSGGGTSGLTYSGVTTQAQVDGGQGAPYSPVRWARMGQVEQQQDIRHGDDKGE